MRLPLLLLVEELRWGESVGSAMLEEDELWRRMIDDFLLKSLRWIPVNLVVLIVFWRPEKSKSSLMLPLRDRLGVISSSSSSSSS